MSTPTSRIVPVTALTAPIHVHIHYSTRSNYTVSHNNLEDQSLSDGLHCGGAVDGVLYGQHPLVGIIHRTSREGDS